MAGVEAGPEPAHVVDRTAGGGVDQGEPVARLLGVRDQGGGRGGQAGRGHQPDLLDRGQGGKCLGHALLGAVVPGHVQPAAAVEEEGPGRPGQVRRATVVGRPRILVEGGELVHARDQAGLPDGPGGRLPHESGGGGRHPFDRHHPPTLRGRVAGRFPRGGEG